MTKTKDKRRPRARPRKYDRLTPATVQRIHDEYVAGRADLRELAAKYAITTPTIVRILKGRHQKLARFDHEAVRARVIANRRKQGRKMTALQPAAIKALRAAFMAGASHGALSAEYGVSKGTICLAVNGKRAYANRALYGEPPNAEDRTRVTTGRIVLQTEAIAADFRAGMSMSALADKYECDIGMISRVLSKVVPAAERLALRQEHEAAARSGRGRKRLIPEDIVLAMRSEYFHPSRPSVREVAERHGFPAATARAAIKGIGGYAGVQAPNGATP